MEALYVFCGIVVGAGLALVFAFRQKKELTAIVVQLREERARSAFAIENLEVQNRELKASIQEQRQNVEQSRVEFATLKEQEPFRQKQVSLQVERLTIAYENLQRQREHEAKLKSESEELKHKLLKDTWLRHEQEVETKIQAVCRQFQMDYVTKEKFPFSGKPDNVIKISDEYVVLDSKSPQGTDLSNFSSYIRTQAEAAKKYLKSEEVKKDLYFVVPNSAIGVIGDTLLNMGSYRVHVITPEGLGPLLLHLQKIQDYEFAESLNPEDRDRIVTVIGKMSHALKRRVQIDYYMANEFIAVLSEAENLPSEILEKSQLVERSSKLNPPIERRNKRTETSELSTESQKLEGKVSAQNVYVGPELAKLAELPLYK